MIADHKQTRSFYDRLSHYYDFIAERSEGPLRMSGLELLNARPGERVLEIGFGTGHALNELAKNVGPRGKVDGLELSEGMLKIAQARLREFGFEDRVSLVSGDALHLPYSENSFDAVFMSFVLELFEPDELPLVLAECRRVLCSDGRLVVVALSKEDRAVVRIYEWLHRRFPHLLDCRPIHVRAALENAGFLIRSAESRTMWLPVEIVLGQNL